MQEALTNVVRHSRATRVDINLDCSEGIAVLEIIDNGIGITNEQLSSEISFGLIGMRERASLCGGYLEIVGMPGKGTVIHATIPCTGEGV